MGAARPNRAAPILSGLTAHGSRERGERWRVASFGGFAASR